MKYVMNHASGAGSITRRTDIQSLCYGRSLCVEALASVIQEKKDHESIVAVNSSCSYLLAS